MIDATLDQLIDDVALINDRKQPKLPFNLHTFLQELDKFVLMRPFEAFLRDYRRTRNE